MKNYSVSQADDKISQTISKLKKIHNEVLDNSQEIIEEISQVNKLSEPFLQQVGGENVCRNNIELTISSIQNILDEIKESDSLVTLIKSKFYVY